VRERLRLRLGDRALAAARRLHRRPYVWLDYPYESTKRPRWGHGRPSHPQLRALLAGQREQYRQVLEAIAAYREPLAAIPGERTAPGEPCWRNRWLPGLDAAALYAFLRRRAPARYLEVGAGMSTLFAARARRDGDLPTCIAAIDPQPREGAGAVADELVRQPLQDTDLGVFAELQAGDVVLFDGSHRAVMNSDVVAFHLEVLPQLPAGVLVGVHDVFLPDDYLPEWSDWRYSEQYLLAAMLLANAPFLRPILPGWYASHDDELASIVDPLFGEPNLAGADRRGFAFWLETAGA
jgi:hypothetical protein